MKKVDCLCFCPSILPSVWKRVNIVYTPSTNNPLFISYNTEIHSPKFSHNNTKKNRSINLSNKAKNEIHINPLCTGRGSSGPTAQQIAWVLKKGVNGNDFPYFGGTLLLAQNIWSPKKGTPLIPMAQSFYWKILFSSNNVDVRKKRTS